MFVLPLGMGGGVAWMLLAPGLWAATAAKGADQALRNSIDQSAREILYLPVPTILKQRAKPFIDVVVTRGADALVGVLILALSGTAALAGRGPALIAIGLVIVWLAAVLGVRRTYRQALEKLLSVRDVDLEAAVEENLDSETVRQITSALHPRTPAEEVHYALDVLKIIPPAALHGEMRGLTGHPEAGVRARALEALNAIGKADDAGTVRPLLDDPDPAYARWRSISSARWNPARTCRDWRKGSLPTTPISSRSRSPTCFATGTRGRPARLPTGSSAWSAAWVTATLRCVARAPGALGRLPTDHPLQLQLEPLLADAEPGRPRGAEERRPGRAPRFRHPDPQAPGVARNARARARRPGRLWRGRAAASVRVVAGSAATRRPAAVVAGCLRPDRYPGSVPGASRGAVRAVDLQTPFVRAESPQQDAPPPSELGGVDASGRTELSQELAASYGTERQLATLQERSKRNEAT